MLISIGILNLIYTYIFRFTKHFQNHVFKYSSIIAFCYFYLQIFKIITFHKRRKLTAEEIC